MQDFGRETIDFLRRVVIQVPEIDIMSVGIEAKWQFPSMG
jgi:hypothetical protein